MIFRITPVAQEVQDATNSLSRIRRYSRWMVAFSWALMLLLPVALVLYWATADVAVLMHREAHLPDGLAPTHVEPWQRGLTGVVVMVPLGFLLMALAQVRGCFALFAQGQVFTHTAAQRLRSFAAWVAAATVTTVVASTVNSIIWTWNNPPGMRHLAVGISSDLLVNLFFAALVYVIADVMVQAQGLAEENARFV